MQGGAVAGGVLSNGKGHIKILKELDTLYN